MKSGPLVVIRVSLSSMGWVEWVAVMGEMASCREDGADH